VHRPPDSRLGIWAIVLGKTSVAKVVRQNHHQLQSSCGPVTHLVLFHPVCVSLILALIGRAGHPNVIEIVNCVVCASRAASDLQRSFAWTMAGSSDRSLNPLSRPFWLPPRTRTTKIVFHVFILPGMTQIH
jgi:hypothetical protein